MTVPYLPVAILAIKTARAFMSAGRFSPLGPLGIVVHLFQLRLYVCDFVFQRFY